MVETALRPSIPAFMGNGNGNAAGVGWNGPVTMQVQVSGPGVPTVAARPLPPEVQTAKAAFAFADLRCPDVYLPLLGAVLVLVLLLAWAP